MKPLEIDNETQGNGHLVSNAMTVESDSRVPFQRRWWFHCLLFVLTFGIVFATGATTLLNQALNGEWHWNAGFQYAFSLMGILTAHELGHYFAARYHGLDVTLPYFLPGFVIPPIGNPGTTFMPGTFGAFIRIKTPIRTRTQLMDVGAAGPIAGFVFCLIVLIYGFSNLPPKEYAYQFYEPLVEGQQVLTFGSSWLFKLLADALGGDRMPALYDIVHYPYLFAGWFGLVLTAINLLPIGQFDGGHVLYAMLGKRQKYFGYTAFAGILLLAFFYNIISWVIWAILVLVVIKIKHPPVVEDDEAISPARKWVGVACVVIFILCFMPAPIYIMTYHP